MDADQIVLDDNYLHALRETAWDWAVQTLSADLELPRRAAIVMGRNLVTAIDEIHALRARGSDE
jgi:hypothetical protein